MLKKRVSIQEACFSCSSNLTIHLVFTAKVEVKPTFLSIRFSIYH